METGRADTAGVEGVPGVAAGAGPAVVLAGGPAAERTADARPGRTERSLLAGFGADVRLDYSGLAHLSNTGAQDALQSNGRADAQMNVFG